MHGCLIYLFIIFILFFLSLSFLIFTVLFPIIVDLEFTLCYHVTFEYDFWYSDCFLSFLFVNICFPSQKRLPQLPNEINIYSR